MNLSLPADATTQIASTTSSAIFAFAAPAELVIGILLAFLVLELIIGSFSTTPTHSPSGEQ